MNRQGYVLAKNILPLAEAHFMNITSENVHYERAPKLARIQICKEHLSSQQAKKRKEGNSSIEFEECICVLIN